MINADMSQGPLTSEASKNLNSQSLANGHKYTYVAHSLNWKVSRFFKALALTILTLGLALASSFVRQLWIEGLTGKEKIEVKTTLNEQENKAQTIAQESLVSSTKDESASDQLKEKGVISNQKSLENEEPLEVYSSQNANQLVQSLLKNSTTLTNQQLSQFENLTELDFSLLTDSVSKKHIQSILKECKKIEVIKLSVKEINNNHASDDNLLAPIDMFRLMLNQPKEILSKIQIQEEGLVNEILLHLNQKEGLELSKLISLKQLKSHIEGTYPQLDNNINIQCSVFSIFNSLEISELATYLPKFIKKTPKSHLDFFSDNVYNKKLSEIIGFVVENDPENFELIIKTIFDSFGYEIEAINSLIETVFSHIPANAEVIWFILNYKDGIFNDAIFNYAQEHNWKDGKKIYDDHWYLLIQKLKTTTNINEKFLTLERLLKTDLNQGGYLKLTNLILDNLEQEKIFNGLSDYTFEFPSDINFLKVIYVASLLLKILKTENLNEDEKQKEIIKNLLQLSSPPKEDQVNNDFKENAVMMSFVLERCEPKDYPLIFSTLVKHREENQSSSENCVKALVVNSISIPYKKGLDILKEFWRANKYFGEISCIKLFENEHLNFMFKSIPDDIEDDLLQDILTDLIDEIKEEKINFSSEEILAALKGKKLKEMGHKILFPPIL